MWWVTVLPSRSVLPTNHVWTIVVGGGSGRRFGGQKQFERIAGRRIIDLACEAAAAAGDGVVIVVPAELADRENAVAGGETRSASVRAGLAAVPDEATIICVHDAARPFATAGLFKAVVDAVAAGADGAVPGVPVADTIKVVDGDGVVLATPDRESLVAVQTPQAFRAQALRLAHAAGDDGTDDATLVERQGGRIVVVPGEPGNRKITHPDDLAWARRRMAAV
jgi:2-C-methyl-D-erythritol 4-phosphate cytidylyltransferase